MNKLYIVTKIYKKPYNVGNQFEPLQSFDTWKEANEFKDTIPVSKDYIRWVVVFP